MVSPSVTAARPTSSAALAGRTSATPTTPNTHLNNIDNNIPWRSVEVVHAFFPCMHPQPDGLARRCPDARRPRGSADAGPALYANAVGMAISCRLRATINWRCTTSQCATHPQARRAWRARHLPRVVARSPCPAVRTARHLAVWPPCVITATKENPPDARCARAGSRIAAYCGVAAVAAASGVTRQMMLARSSATINAPRGSTVTPTGRPRVLPSSPWKPETKSID